MIQFASLYISAFEAVREDLLPVLNALKTLDQKSREFDVIIKQAGHIFRTPSPSGSVRRSGATQRPLIMISAAFPMRPGLSCACRSVAMQSVPG
jgi:hypothetical protein